MNKYMHDCINPLICWNKFWTKVLYKLLANRVVLFNIYKIYQECKTVIRTPKFCITGFYPLIYSMYIIYK